ncbi:MAG: hypothetical protein M1816_007858 [Peltula sp. TS41687]|nr:MAG: hypothetical protein M1816_007858 [Peltula sp. TS41687]
MVKKVSKPHEAGPELVRGHNGYTWYEMGFFARWDTPDHCRVLCVDTPEYLHSELEVALEKQTALNFKDPFTMHRHLIDQILVLYDISVWRVRDPVRVIEKSRGGAGKKFDDMHEMARHGIHVTEVLAVSIETVDAMREYQAAIHNYKTLNSVLEYTDRQQAGEYMKFQVQVLKSLKRRSESNDKRLHNEIELAFFSTTFFTFDEDNWKSSVALAAGFAFTVSQIASP